MTQPEMLVDCQCDLAENPLWHPQEQRLYWTDIIRGRLFRYDPQTGGHEEIYRGETVGGFTLQADGSLLLFMERGAIATWREGRLDYLVREIPEERDNRFNDVIADPRGRVFCGTLAEPFEKRGGRLYRLEPDGSLHLLLEGIGIANGMGFTPDRRQFYFTDSLEQTIYLFDYQEETGALTGQRAWLQTPAGAGEPDGMTVDAHSHVWSARWGSAAVYRYAPDGTEERRIELPARLVTSVTFGGPDYRDLYITTALAGGTKTENGPGAGALFRLRTRFQGVPEFFSRIQLGSLG